MVSFWTAGVNLTISSDDPPLFGITMIDELRNCVRLTGASRDDLAERQRRGARAAFPGEEVKARLLSQIDSWADSNNVRNETLASPAR